MLYPKQQLVILGDSAKSVSTDRTCVFQSQGNTKDDVCKHIRNQRELPRECFLPKMT